MATKPNSNPPPAITPDPDSDAYDPNRFTVTRMPTEFVRWMLNHPLPKARKGELWKDTLPPGMGASPSPGDEGAPTSAAWRPAGPSPLASPPPPGAGAEPKSSYRSTARIIGWLGLGAGLVAGAVVLFALNTTPKPEEANETATSKERTSQRALAPAAQPIRPVSATTPAHAAPQELTPAPGVDDKSTQAVIQGAPPSTSPAHAARPPHEKVPSPKPAARAASEGDLELIVGQ